MRRLLLPLAAPLLAACGGPPSAANAPPSAAPPDAHGRAAAAAAPSSSAPAAVSAGDAAKRQAALSALVANEAKTGTCDKDHEAALEKLASDFEAAVKAKGDDGKPLNVQTVSKRVLALGPSARGVEMSVTGHGTELHVLAFGARDVSMDVLAGTSAATTMRSPLKTLLPTGIDLPNVGHAELQNDSRQVVIKPGQPLQVKLTGEGCAAMIAFVKE